MDLADAADERATLERRYLAAKDEAARRGASHEVARLESMAESCRIVLALPAMEAIRVLGSDRELVRTFYARGASRLDKGALVFEGDEWDAIRPAAEAAMFGDANKEHIHFATLSPDDSGLSTYGECSLTLRDSLTSHRTSAFEENMLSFLKSRAQQYFRDARLPRGFRSTWEDRGRLATAKLASQVQAGCDEDSLQRLLFEAGPTGEQDRYIELHVFGEMTGRTVERAVLTRRPADVRRSILRAVEWSAQQLGVQWVDRTRNT